MPGKRASWWLIALIAVVGAGWVAATALGQAGAGQPQAVSDDERVPDDPVVVPPASTSGLRTAPPASSADATTRVPPVASGPASAPPDPDSAPFGAVTAVPASANAQVASVAEALQMKSHPERLSALIAAPSVDVAAIAANRDAYIAVVQPGRVFATAAPDVATPVLRPLSATQVTARQDETVILRVVTAPHAMVSFTSFDLGRFDNQLAAQTVAADAHGVAAVGFTAGAGTIDAVHILAGSPQASGQVAFDLVITPAPRL